MAAESMKREKVVSYLAGLSPAARDMLLRKLEIAGAAGDPQARTVLEAARDLVRIAGPAPAPQKPAPRPAEARLEPAPTATRTLNSGVQSGDVKERLFAPFIPFVIDETLTEPHRGCINRSSVDLLWAFLEREVLADALLPWTAGAIASSGVTEAEFDAAVRTMRAAALGEIRRRIRDSESDPRLGRRLAVHFGSDQALVDARTLLDLQDRLPSLERLVARLPATIGSTDTAERLAADTVKPYLDSRPEDADYVAALVAGRVATPATLFRLAVLNAGSDDVADIRGTPAEAFVEAALGVAARAVVRFESDWRAGGDTAGLVATLRRFHEVVRGGTTTVLLNDDSAWRSRFVDLRRQVSEVVTAAVEDVLPVLRRGLRVSAGGRLSLADAAEAVRVITVFSAAKRHREALALNHLVTRLGASVEQAIDVYGRELIEQLPKARGEARSEMIAASDHLLKMAEMTHGEEFAGLMRKSRDLALGRTG